MIDKNIHQIIHARTIIERVIDFYEKCKFVIDKQLFSLDSKIIIQSQVFVKDTNFWESYFLTYARAAIIDTCNIIDILKGINFTDIEKYDEFHWQLKLIRNQVIAHKDKDATDITFFNDKSFYLSERKFIPVVFLSAMKVFIDKKGLYDKLLEVERNFTINDFAEKTDNINNNQYGSYQKQEDLNEFKKLQDDSYLKYKAYSECKKMLNKKKKEYEKSLKLQQDYQELSEKMKTASKDYNETITQIKAVSFFCPKWP